MKLINRLGMIISWKTLLVAISAVISTYVCIYFDVTAEFPLTLIATAIIFPIVFSIGGAYKRREVALDEYGSIKAHGRAIYFASRDWLPEANENSRQRCRDLMRQLFEGIRELFTQPVSKLRENEEAVYTAFSELSHFVRDDLRHQGLATGECSRCNQYLSKMTISFERIKHIYQYRTPRTLRAFSELFITVLPPLYGPYFAHEAKEYTSGLVYVMPVLFSVVLVSLYNIQHHLENPFDQVGEDDVSFNVEQFIKRLN